MATEKQIAANRINAAKGGPKTEAGRNRCRTNAIKHGLTCRAVVVMPGESEEEYQTLLSEFTASFKPRNAIEQMLVVRLANVHWKSQRKEGAEAGLLWWAVIKERASIKEAGDEAGVDASHVPQDRYLGLSFLRHNGAMERYLRYQAAIDREFHKTLDELMRILKLRQSAPPARAQVRPEPRAMTRPAQSTASAGIGTVSQSPDAAADVQLEFGKMGPSISGPSVVPPHGSPEAGVSAQ